MKSYLGKEKVLEAVTALKAYCNSVYEERKAKRPLLGDTSATDVVNLKIELKKVPTNIVTFSTLIGPLPNPWQIEYGSDICLFVRDLDTKKSLSDRELDLQLTRQHYETKLLDAGFDDDFIKQRISILPMRQLITEYKTQEAKSKLCSAYDIFLAEHSLMNNRFKHLNLALGSKFWVTKKKTPIPIKITKLDGQELKHELLNAIQSTKLVINGRGTTLSVECGVYAQTEKQLSENLSFILTEVYKILGNNVAMLRIKKTEDIGIPIFADLGWKNDVKLTNPRRNKAPEAIIDEFPLFNQTDIAVYPSGEVKLIKSHKQAKENEKISTEDQFLNNLEDKWTKITNAVPKKRVARLPALAKKRPRPNPQVE